MSAAQLITGIGGQDGAYLAAQLLARGEHVLGTRRPGADPAGLWRLRELGIDAHAALRIVELDLTRLDDCRALLAAEPPAAVFHLAAQSRVSAALRDPYGSATANGVATLTLLEAVHRVAPSARFVFASSAELYGGAAHAPQDERTPFAPAGPYAVAKHFAHGMTQAYRAAHGLHASCAILFNHESPLRDAEFVTRKIAAAAARAHAGGAPLALGNLDARRDFGYAPEYTAALAAMAAQPQPDDYVLATGVATSIREFATLAFAAAGVTLQWHGSGTAEQAIDAQGRVRVVVDPALFRPVDAALLVGDARKARARLGFDPRTSVGALARLMVEAERRRP